MKKSILLVALAAVVSTVFAMNIAYDRKRSPRMSLPSAYERAVHALDTATNQFHCVGASLEWSLSRDGEWRFGFSTTNGTLKWVTVDFGGKATVEDILVRF